MVLLLSFLMIGGCAKQVPLEVSVGTVIHQYQTVVVDQVEHTCEVVLGWPNPGLYQHLRNRRGDEITIGKKMESERAIGAHALTYRWAQGNDHTIAPGVLWTSKPEMIHLLDMNTIDDVGNLSMGAFQTNRPIKAFCVAEWKDSEGAAHISTIQWPQFQLSVIEKNPLLEYEILISPSNYGSPATELLDINGIPAGFPR